MDVLQLKGYRAISEQLSRVCIVVIDSAEPDVFVSSKVSEI